MHAGYARGARPELELPPDLPLRLGHSLLACTIDRSLCAQALYSNIVLTGGSTLFPNFRERLVRELRSLVPTEYAINVSAAKAPLLSAWHGGSSFAASEEYASQVVTKREYQEHGHALCRQRFAAA